MRANSWCFNISSFILVEIFVIGGKNKSRIVLHLSVYLYFINKPNLIKMLIPIEDALCNFSDSSFFVFSFVIIQNLVVQDWSMMSFVWCLVGRFQLHKTIHQKKNILLKNQIWKNQIPDTFGWVKLFDNNWKSFKTKTSKHFHLRRQ